jgi:hypothetical protein
MGLITEEVGDVPREWVEKPPARIGEITTWRTTFPGQVFAVVKTEGACPGTFTRSRACSSRRTGSSCAGPARHGRSPSPGFPCSKEVYVKYEIMRVPKDVEPKFVFVGACLPVVPGS